MKNKHFIFVVIKLVVCLALFVFLCGCVSMAKLPKLAPDAENFRSEFLLNYSFFISKDEIKEMRNCVTVQDLQNFSQEFWKIRDTDPGTPQNEFKELVDERINDIKNEILFHNVDTIGVRFDANGGLKGDMARVYLLYGMPQYKERLPEGNTYVELMTWVYANDTGNNVLFRFLFYNKYGSFKALLNSGQFFMQVSLREISNRIVSSDEELSEMWQELRHQDVNRVFISAILEFSPYDISIDEALKAPKPAELVAQKFKPEFLGQPEESKGEGNKKFIYGGPYNSILASDINIRYSIISLIVKVSNLDWEIVEERGESLLVVQMAFQNEKTGETKEFFGNLKIEMSKKDLLGKRKDEILEIVLTEELHSGDKSFDNFDKWMQKLGPGAYVLTVYVQNELTKKYNVLRKSFIKH